jgi:hypothetical protein
MAKVKMMCPFSGQPCRECSVYRGRHYYLCFRGKNGEEVAGLVKPIVRPASPFDSQGAFHGGIYDPFAHPMKGSVLPEGALE